LVSVRKGFDLDGDDVMSRVDLARLSLCY